MIGIFVKPMKLVEALRNTEAHLELLQRIDLFGKDKNLDVLDDILYSNKPEEEKLNDLLKEGFISERHYDSLKRKISDEKTTPRKIVDYFKDGPITLRQAMYAFCTDGKILKEFERQRIVGSYFTEHELLGLVKDKMNIHEYVLVFNNSVGYGEEKWDKY